MSKSKFTLAKRALLIEIVINFHVFSKLVSSSNCIICTKSKTRNWHCIGATLSLMKLGRAYGQVRMNGFY